MPPPARSPSTCSSGWDGREAMSRGGRRRRERGALMRDAMSVLVRRCLREAYALMDRASTSHRRPDATKIDVRPPWSSLQRARHQGQTPDPQGQGHHGTAYNVRVSAQPEAACHPRERRHDRFREYAQDPSMELRSQKAHQPDAVPDRMDFAESPATPSLVGVPARSPAADSYDGEDLRHRAGGHKRAYGS